MSDNIHDEADDGDVNLNDTFVASPQVPVAGSALKIYQVGDVTVVGFTGCEIIDNLSFSEYRSQILELIGESNCLTVAFDLTGVKLIPSGMLGMLASIRNRVERIEVYNCSPDVIEVLQVTHLDRLIEIKDFAA